MDVYSTTLKIEADTKGADQYVASLKRVSDADRAYQTVADRTGEALDQVRTRFERASNQIPQLINNQRKLVESTKQVDMAFSKAFGFGVGAGTLLRKCGVPQRRVTRYQNVTVT